MKLKRLKPIIFLSGVLIFQATIAIYPTVGQERQKSIQQSSKGVTIYNLDLVNSENRTIEFWMKAGGTNPSGETLNVNSLFWSKNNQPWIPIMGEFHYARFPHAEWEEQLLKMKAAGISIISTYVFWVNSEFSKGTWNWSGDNNLRLFIQLCQKHGLYVWLRPGPYINAEARNGGLPDWINKSGKRSDAPWYIEEVTQYYGQVAEQTKGFFYKDGGPIIGLQVDNEFAYGDAQHLSTLLKIAQDAGMVAPFNTCTNNSKYKYEKGDMIPLQGAYPYRGWGVPEPTTDYLYSSDEWNAMENIGGLPYDGTKFPRGMAELGVGCWQNYQQRFIVPVYDSEGHLQNCIGRGVNLPGYYMFQGGTQKAGFEANEMPLTYDFQAPLGEYGQVRQSYHALKLIHHFLNDYGQSLAPMQPVRPDPMVLDPKNTDHLRYIGRFDGDRGFLFLTTTQCRVMMKPLENIQIKLKLGQETLFFPEKPFTLRANLAPIFPINMDLNGSNLKYATAQPLCNVENKEITYYFFFAIDGITPEFVLDNSTVSKLKSEKPYTSSNGRLTLLPTTGLDQAFAVTGKNGKQAVVVLLSRKQAEQSWRLNFRGKERLLLSNANLLINEDIMELCSDSNVMNLYCFPALTEPDSIKTTKNHGLFSQTTFSVPKANLLTKVEKVSIHEWKVKIQSLPKNIKDIFLNVDYIGSTSDVLLDGKKYSDDLYNGKGWDIGIKRFLDEKTHELTIRANAWDNEVKGIASENQPKNELESKGLIRKVTIIPEYIIRIK